MNGCSSVFAKFQAHFDLEMCFSPQRRAIFQHLNFKKLSILCYTWILWEFVSVLSPNEIHALRIHIEDVFF